jgi:hypothetical protein
MVMSVYVDDVTFSSNNPIIKRYDYYRNCYIQIQEN